MSKSTYQILAIIYELLGKYDFDSFMVASKKRGLPDNIKMALHLLADEAKSTDIGEFQDYPTRVIRTRKPKRQSKRIPNLSPDLPSDIYRKNLLEFLENPSNFKTRGDLLELISMLGYPLVISNKASRERVVKQIVSLVIDNEVLRKNLHEMFSSDSNDQTEGWLKLIRGEK